MTSCALLVLGLAAACQTLPPANVILAGPQRVDVRPVYDPLRPPPLLPSRPAHKFYDRPAKLELVAWSMVGGADLAQTCRFLGRGGREDWMPVQSCVGMVGLAVGAIAVVELASWALHRHGHHRLERVPRLVGIGSNALGLGTSIGKGSFR